MKKKYRLKKIEEKEKVSTHNNKNNFPGLSGSGDPQKRISFTMCQHCKRMNHGFCATENVTDTINHKTFQTP